MFQPGSAFHQKTTDILIEDGIIAQIGAVDTVADARVLEANGIMVSIGWVDARTSLCDPGHEEKENLLTGCMAAAKGGFTAVACLPNTNPVVDSKSIVEYIRNQAANQIVSVFPMGSISKGMAGEELAELYDMHVSGAIGFADAGTKSGLMLRALQYSKTFGSVIISTPDDKNLSASGRMHEGHVNVGLGMKGIPTIAETIALKRDLDLLRYTGGRLHISKVSTAESVELLRQAKAEGLNLTADVTIHHLCHSDDELITFDSNFKFFPPLRSKDHINALIAGVNDGTIDAIVSDHCPENIETKDVEFEYATMGATGLQQLFSMYCMKLQGQLPLERFVEAVTSGPRKIFGKAMPEITIGQKAELTIFNSEATWELNEESNASQSTNSYWYGRQMTGKAIGIVNGEKFLWFG